MSVNAKEIPILVTYYTKSRIICQQEFGPFSNFETLLNFFNSNIKNSEIKLKEKYLLNNREIKNSDLLINIIQTYASSKKILNANFSIEIEEINNIGDENFPCFKKILQPSRNKFGIYVFIPENGIISLEEYPENLMNKYELEKFNISSTYCNSPKSLFISGGKFNKDIIDNFWVIDNEFYTIKKLKMFFPKSNHSMIYIKTNKKEIIFIAGGDDLKTFFYDIKNNNFIQWGDMNASHSRPGLINIGDYLYCFHLMKDQDNKIFLEKTNLNDKNHLWEKVYPNFESEEIINKIINAEFGLSLCAGDKVMLIGGNLNNSNSYLYDINMNLFLFNDKCKNYFFPLIDKNFYKINKNHNISLPASLSRHVEIGILNKKKYTLRKLNLKPKDRTRAIKFNNIYNEDSSAGKVIVEFKTEDENEEYDANNGIYNDKNIIISNLDINTSNNNNYEKNESSMNNNCINNENYKKKNNFNINYIDNNNKNLINSNNDKNNIAKSKNKFQDNGLVSNDNIIENKNVEFKKNSNIKKNKKQNIFDINTEYNKMLNNTNDLEINNIQQDNNIYIDNDNVVSESEKNADYILQDKSDYENNKHAKEQIEEKNEENNINYNNNNKHFNSSGEEIYENAMNEKMEENNDEEEGEKEFEELKEEDINEFNEENNNYEENGGEMNEEMEINGNEYEENEEEEQLERDRFELTIVQNIGEDIIQIENYPEYHIEEDNFCDYDLGQEEKF